MSNFQDFLDSLDDDEQIEWYGTNQEVAREVMGWYSRWLSGSLNSDNDEEQDYEPDMSNFEVIEND